MYAFLTGPGVWIAFTVFIVGLIVRVAFLYGLSLGRDPVLYNHASLAWGSNSIFFWLLPLGSVSLRRQPVFALAAFIFHLTLLGVPIFLAAHNILLEEAWGLAPPSLPDGIADGASIVMIAAGLFLLIRRLARPEVRILTTPMDYAALLLTMAPFVTGVMAYHQWGHYETVMILHFLSAELLLILIPFTKLAHVALFFFTRAFIGFEMGTRRGARTW